MEVYKTIYFVRHGQSEANISDVFQGPDSPLSEKGKYQASKIAERVSKLNFEALISSTYLRAKQTTKIISDLTGKQPEFSDIFIERIKPSSINGKPFSDEKANKTYEDWFKSMYTSGLRVEDGENFDDFITRADQSLEFLKNRKEESIVVVTHGMFLKALVARVILGELLGGDIIRKFYKQISAENTGITVIRYQTEYNEDAKWRLWIFNDHAHLGD